MKKAIFITAVSLAILAETGVLQVATEKLEAFRKRLQEKYAAKEQKLAEELAQKANKQERPTKRPYEILKLNGNLRFSLDEAIRIQETFFSDVSVNQLFRHD